MKKTKMQVLIFAIIIIFIITMNFFQPIAGQTIHIPSQTTSQQKTNLTNPPPLKIDLPVECYFFTQNGKQHYQKTSLTTQQIQILITKINTLQTTQYDRTQQDIIQQQQNEILELLQQYNLIQKNFELQTLFADLTPRFIKNNSTFTTLDNPATATFCNFLTAGVGSAFPIIILPRLVPFLLTPIPRLFVRWKTNEGTTSCGSLATGKGFIATGMQDGLALGFWGIGFSIFIPPLYAYGLFGYALYASVNAEFIEPYPPNSPPMITNENPPDNAYDVPITLSELQFTLSDIEGELMDYTITTDPDVGSGQETGLSNGTYTVEISNLKPCTEYRWTIKLTDGLNTVTKEYYFSTEEIPFNPFDEGWSYRKEITINHNLVEDDLVYFPVLIHTVDTDFLGKTQPDGDDFLFMDGPDIANKLYHEIEYYTDSTGELTAWVNIPSISANTDTIFYIYYGNPTSNNQQQSKRVWSNHFNGVWHFNNLEDSTSHENHGSNHGTTICAGKIGQACSFDGINDYITVSDDESLNFHDTNQFTLSLWINDAETLITHSQGLISKGTGAYDKGYNLIISKDDNFIGLYVRDGSTTHRHISSQTLTEYTWHHIVGIWDGTIQYTYIDGVFDNSTTQGQIIISDDHKTLEFGNHYGYTDNYHPYHGILDEIHIIDTIRSPAWISTEYNNQNDPNNFHIFGPEETGP